MNRLLILAGGVVLSALACTSTVELDTLLSDCGGGTLDGPEACDDGNRDDLDGCNAVCKIETGFTCMAADNAASVCAPICGDGLTLGGEECDDSILDVDDGCDNQCFVEVGWTCTSSPSAASVCNPICGDGLLVGGEECDDAGTMNGDGCASICRVEAGFTCTTTVAPSVCANICGDGLVVGVETCDDANVAAEDGCSGCVVEDGWSCTREMPSRCFPCGDGVIEGAEQCDDGGRVLGDGCNRSCVVETGWTCTGAPSTCAPICGDGLVLGPEPCDDGNTDDGDGCAAACAIEEGFTCETRTSTVPNSLCVAHWQPRAAPMPELAPFAESVFTGTEIIFFGGENPVTGRPANTGNRYALASNTWTETEVNGAPSGRLSHSAVWTGNEMIVFGGSGPGALSDGGRYVPGTGWTAITQPGADNGRTQHTAVWTGTEMIAFGGASAVGRIDGFRNDGFRYDPATDTWTPLPANPGLGRAEHVAVWTGTEMIVYGGIGPSANPDADLPVVRTDALAYNPATNAWRTLAASPLEGRQRAQAVWTGTEMVVFGGATADNFRIGDGARFDPSLNRWMMLPTDGAPSARDEHVMAVGGEDVFVVGGSLDANFGARWRSSDDRWRPVTSVRAPLDASFPAAAWDGQVLIMAGGVEAAAYRPPD